MSTGLPQAAALPVPGKGVLLGAITLLRNLLPDPAPEAIANSLAVSILRFAYVVALLPALPHNAADENACYG